METPKILYQTWKTYSIPEKFKKYRQKWIETTPGYKHVLLDDKDLRNLVKDSFPQYLNAYDSFTANIERVDFARYVMMYLGGVYADFDTFPLKNIDKFVEMNKVVLGREPLEHSFSIYGREIVICNAFMISPPKQKLWIDLMNYIVENYEPYYKPVETTGPMAFTKFYEAYPKAFGNVMITDPCVFFPITGEHQVSKFCDIKNSYLAHIWTNTWTANPWNDQLWYNKRYWFYASILIFVIVWVLLFFRSKGN